MRFGSTSLILSQCEPPAFASRLESLELQVGVGVASSRPSDPAIPRGSLVVLMWERQSQPISRLVHGCLKVETGLPALRENWADFSG